MRDVGSCGMWGQVPHLPFLGLSVELKALSVMPRCDDLACWEKDLIPCVRWALALDFDVGFWCWVLVLGFGGPERARHDSPGQRPGLNAPMISSPEGAAPWRGKMARDVGSRCGVRSPIAHSWF